MRSRTGSIASFGGTPGHAKKQLRPVKEEMVELQEQTLGDKLLGDK